MTSFNAIVQVSVQQVQAPTPSKLQKTGAFISQGGTNTSPGTMSLLTQLADLTPLLTPAKTLVSIDWDGGVVTATATVAHGYPIGEPMLVTISGALPAGYNGTYSVTPTTSTAFTYELDSDPGVATATGVYTPVSVSELVAMATTFFAQGAQQAVYVLELGPGSVDGGVADLSAWITANPEVIYSYLVPRAWDANADFIDLLGDFNATTAKTYFFVTTTLQNYGLYTDLMKCVFALIEAPVYSKWSANALTAISVDGDGMVTASTTTAHGVSPGDYFQISGCTPADFNGRFLALPGTSGSTLFYAIDDGSNIDPVFASATFAAGTGDVTITTDDPHGLEPGDYLAVSNVTGTGAYALAEGYWPLISGTTGSTLVYNAVDPTPANPTFDSATYDDLTGNVTITTAAPHGLVPGDEITVSAAAGTGSYVAIEGTVELVAGTTGSTLIYTISDGLTMTISGATIVVVPIAMTFTGMDLSAGASVLGTLVASFYESDGVTATEFTNAAPFWVTLNYNPSNTNKITPTAFSYLFGVTPFPTSGNAALLATLKAASINIVGTGAEGGITNTILDWGTTKDGRDFTYWYSVDWVQINVALNVANAVINGSNNRLNPLYFNQDGINRLQQVVASTMASGVTFGLVLGQVLSTELDGPEFDEDLDSGEYAGQTVVNAVPFVPYNVANPSHYAIGQYDGLSILYTPTRGFIQIGILVVVTDFVAQ